MPALFRRAFFKLSPRAVTFSFTLILITAAGCGGADYAEVGGTITSDGKPQEGINVSFEPVEGEPGEIAVGSTNTEGRYVLKSPDGKRTGARVGANRVMLSSEAPESEFDDERAALPQEIVPKKFRDGSELFDVPVEGTTEANFEF